MLLRFYTTFLLVTLTQCGLLMSFSSTAQAGLQDAPQATSASGPPVLIKGFPPSPLGQVPGSVAKILRVKTANANESVIEFQNTGTRPIRAFVFRLIDPTAPTPARNAKMPWRGAIQIWELDKSSALGPGEKGTVDVWPQVTNSDLATQVEIAAVIFADGGHIGSAPNPYRGGDMVTEIFDGWRGEADGYAAWQRALNPLTDNVTSSNDKNWFADLLSRVNTTPFDGINEDGTYSAYKSGVARANSYIQHLAQRLQEEVNRGARAPASARRVIEQQLTFQVSQASSVVADFARNNNSKEVEK